ncbi:MAG: hypothetical protein ABW019_03195 [Chitinophagaceae bacterium]
MRRRRRRRAKSRLYPLSAIGTQLEDPGTQILTGPCSSVGQSSIPAGVLAIIPVATPIPG